MLRVINVAAAGKLHRDILGKPACGRLQSQPDLFLKEHHDHALPRLRDPQHRRIACGRITSSALPTERTPMRFKLVRDGGEPLLRVFGGDGVIVHDDVPHPEEMTFDEEERPQ